MTHIKPVLSQAAISCLYALQGKRHTLLFDTEHYKYSSNFKLDLNRLGIKGVRSLIFSTATLFLCSKIDS